ncbi:MAG: hypothetical protein US83_C0002G0075 [Candidatus Falkowbacteria bacterium GW2011_GWC2_38_22]|uniref:Uncharacterized protein n=1 Tax=Candidatus Falkowbacteria bacterium GW2011_GWE1_38_31 TaxID=1618638 RepID=A0A0G0JVT4_9BACT|nr:MAG: hypothetical protein US73_C0007G0075 [Candidatus Falkowbacteria bacterium GW2011_GWF2_38_1205]KKQ61986.1 MAG: hypothetical protein US83_C0002G0075 [Candidatus Falkowbacteria bacterium GW2011_GWC2_38_22]KKQ63852.1 MAG: hypothetical protein US84_C0003G0042 [Candidatus Falkowbacteria bacterium GW2011_GWF1_38_22]KKQ66109.1 MAG: hypothetical protein US87_C0003G0042 [Candidatus Falkowbacteria bacterium GW2011_GWE2_38_254]KKQ70712.1 MAG: hypothetical protein US91_C0003G0042 [Candidatus Falkowb
MTKTDIISLFHHIHHHGDDHKVHHCGGRHVVIDKKLDYNIWHCACGKHCIDKQIAIGHATDSDLNSVEVKIKFQEYCPESYWRVEGGWHIESGRKIE